MRFIRQRFVLRVFSIFSILLLLNTVIFPTVSYALTTGPHQPEYTSYEDASATDMVNLLTGDFTYTMPILNVPIGNEGSFTVPLSYHAGIGTDQESSWIGLGFNINVGSITRNINGFPDDANGESQTVNVKDLTGNKGWYSNSLAGQYGWDSQGGHYGSLSMGALSINYDKAGTDVGLAGIHVGKDPKFNAVEFGITIARLVADILTEGSLEVEGLAMNIAMDVGSHAIVASSFSPPQAPNLGGYWEYSHHTDSKLLGAYKNYWYWLDKTRIEDMYGLLYLHKAPTDNFVKSDYNADIKVNMNGLQPVKIFKQSTDISNKGAASDINIDLSNNSSYWNNESPTMLAYDNYYVNGPGISGSIKPYRMEEGSVSTPREMTRYHVRLNPVPFIDYGSNKVPFVYAGTSSNSYFNHVGGNPSVTIPSIYFGINSAVETGAAGNVNNNAIRYDLNDLTFSTQRFGSNLTTRQKLSQGNYIDWFTNAELNNTGKFLNTAYMDYFPASKRSAFRTAYQFGANNTFFGTSATGNSTNNTTTIQLAAGQNISTLNLQSNYVVDVNVFTEYRDTNGNVVYTSITPYTGVTIGSVTSTQVVLNNINISIASTAGHVEIVSKNEPKSSTMTGGFVITSVDGMNYHYALPVYDYNFSSKTVDKSDASKNSTITRSGQFANTWLLTAITGPDFVDRGGATNDGDGYIDENDWGYWIKFNYGSQSTDYMWRFPYVDNSTTPSTTPDPEDKYLSYSQGLKEKYYLNSIETRSHTALFLKGSRNDAKDASTSKKPSLRLCEIALVTKDSYKQLIDPTGTLKLQDCSGTKDVLYQYTGSTTGNNITTGQEAFIKANAIRRVIFNSGKTTSVADYNLCQGALNSDFGYGKLTLNSISVLGRNDAKVLPDYKFTYGNNPVYDVNKWDGFGMYSSSGTSDGTTHRPSLNTATATADASAWSLTSIKSPLGHSIDIAYERDTYSSVSGITSPTEANYSASLVNIDASKTELKVPNSLQYKPGEQVYVTGSITFCHCSNDVAFVNQPVPSSFSGGLHQVISSNATSVFLDQNFGVPCPANASAQISYTGTIKKMPPTSKPGGNLRVGSITLNDNGGQQYKTRYLYEQNGVSSGVISVEPQYIRVSDTDYPFYKWLDYPATPVMYGKVSVLTGKLSTDTDYTTKTVYQFETPDQSQYINNITRVKDKELLSKFVIIGIIYGEYSSLLKFDIKRTTSKIGKLKSIETFDNSASATPYSSQVFSYTSSPLNGGINNYQGIYSEGNMLYEIVKDTNDQLYHKAQKTTVLDYPYVLQKVVSTVDGQTTVSTNTDWDFITGAVLEKQDKSPLGIWTKTAFQPVYKIAGTGLEYYKMGSKAVDPSYKNMLSQIGATYNYLIDDNGNELGLLGASATTWKKDLATYSVLNGGIYGPSADLDLNGDNTVSASETAAAQVWRKSKSYVWMGDKTRLNSSGVHNFSSGDKFDFVNGATSLWKKTSNFERFDHNSQILEAKDLHDISSSAKYGYSNRLLLASAVNASYYEMAYSGAEDRLNSTSAFFGGEVGLGTGSAVVTTPLHTGKLALSVPSGSYGFVYKTPLTTGILPNKKYRVSVWTTNSTNGKIYYKINNNGVAGTEVVPSNQTITTPITSITLNGTTWYRLDAFIDIGNVAIPSIEVGVKSLSGTVVFDDFRFQPADAAMSCNVYNPVTYNLEYVLDNDNVYTRYEYNDQGALIKTYFESFKPGQVGERLISETKNDFRRFYIDK